MSQEDQVMRNESEQEEAFSGSEDGETGSETEHSPIRTKGDGSDRNKFHFSFQVQGQTQATDGDGHGVSSCSDSLLILRSSLLILNPIQSY
jgi:hypothetical protein